MQLVKKPAAYGQHQNIMSNFKHSLRLCQQNGSRKLALNVRTFFLESLKTTSPLEQLGHMNRGPVKTPGTENRSL